MNQYQPSVIESAAARMESTALTLRVGSVLVGLLLGAALCACVGYCPEGDEVSTLSPVAGASIGALVGGRLGASMAAALRLRAQLALCAVRTEMHMRALAGAPSAERGAS